MSSNWRLTFFRDDDETPLVGAVAAGGVVAEASCSTDPSHPRPYLLVPESLAESEVDLAEGRSVIGQANVTVLDKRTVAADQATGWLTALLPVYGTGEAAGQSALNGRRALLEQTDDGATWFRVMDGVIGGVKLNDSLVTYSFEIRDIRERERKVRAFVRSDTTALLPRGVIGGYGLHRGKTLAPRVTPLTGKFKRESGLQGYVEVAGWSGGGLIRKAKPEMVVTKQMREVFKPEQKLVVRVGGLKQYENTYGRVRILWRRKNTSDPWKEIRAPIARQWGERGLIRTRIARIEGPGDEEDRIAPAVWRVVIGGRTSSDLPAHNQEVELIVGYNGPPSEEFPLHLDGMTAGELLKRLYDGEYCEAPDLPGTELRIRYDAAAVLSLATPVRARISESVDDLREWVQEHIYKPLGAAPALDEWGRVKPIRYALPPATVTLTELNDANTAAGAGWEHPLSDAVNHVIVRYHRDYRVKTDQDPEGETSAGDGLASMEVVVEKLDAASVYAIGDKPMEIELNLFRSIGGVEGDAISGDVSDEIGHALALERADQALDRFAYGGQTIQARCRRSTTGHLRAGDWVLVALSWLPDYQTGRRGTSRLAQVTAVKDVDPAWRELTLVDAGPSNQPLPLPGIGVPTATADGVVSVPVTSVPADAFVRVEYAVLAPDRAEPLPGDWRALDRVKGPASAAAPAVAETPPLPAGATVWIRARAEGKQRRPSAWTNAAVVTLPPIPRVGEVRVEIGRVTRRAVVTWLPNAFAAGVRIRWAEHPRDAEEPELASFVDADAAAGVLTLPLTVTAGRSVTVEVEPRSAWDGATASGTAGEPVRATAHLPAADAGRVRVNVEAADDGATGTLTLRVDDPESLVTGVAFVVTDGVGARTTVTASPVSPGVYRHSVGLHAEHNVAVEPVVTLTDGSALRPGSETFDRDHSANLVGRPQVTYDGAQATVSVTADSDTVSLHAQELVGGAWVTPAGMALDRFAMDRRGSFTVAASTAGTRRLRVFGRNAAGTDGPPEEVRIERHRQPSPVTAVAWMEVNPDNPVLADLYLRVEGPQAAFPVRAEIHPDDPGGPALAVSAAGATSITFAAPGEQTSVTAYPGLGGIELPKSGSRRVWVKLTDAQDNPPAWTFTAADRDRVPGGAVVRDDYRPDPALVVTYDEDVSGVIVGVPWPGDGRKYRGFHGLSGGGTLTYRVGVDTLGDGTKEAPFAVDEGAERGAYQVWVAAADHEVLVFSGPLHGAASRPPVVEPTVAIDAALRDRVDVSVKVSSPVGEALLLEMKDSDAPGAPVWSWVLPGTQAPAQAESGGTVPATAKFAAPGRANAQKLNDLALARDQLGRVWVRAVGRDSGVPSAWTPVVLQLREQPWLESVDLSFDEAGDTLSLTAVGGAFCRSAQLSISDDAEFATNVWRETAPLLDGGQHTFALQLTPAGRNRTWYGRVLPSNGPDGTGLAGQAQRDSEFVPAGEAGVEPPTATIEPVSAALMNETVMLRGALGQGGDAPLSWRTRLDDAGGAPGAWSAWSQAPLPVQRTVQRGLRWPRVLRLETADAAGRTAEAQHHLASRLEALDEFGLVDTGIPHRGGHRIFRRQLDTAIDVVEQPGRWFTSDTMLDAERNVVQVRRGGANAAVTRLFDLESDGLDQVREGAAYGKVARSSLTGGRVSEVHRGTGDIAPAAELFRIHRNTLDEVVDGATFARTTLGEKTGAGHAASHLDGSGVRASASVAGRAASTVVAEARLGREGVGTASDNLLVNGGGQEGEPGAQAAGWTHAWGTELQSWVGYARYGDRSLAIAHVTARNSYSHQKVWVEAGELYEAFAWMAVPVLSAAGGQAVINLDGPLTALEATGPWTSGTDVGLPLTQTWDWTFVRSLARAESSDWVTFYLQQGFSGPAHARVHFDGVTFRRVTKYQAEGRRRVDTLYDSDGRLTPAVSVHDPGVQYRNLNDVSRRAQAGLTAWDPAVGGGDLARNVPLPRLEVLAPNISMSTGRITSVDDGAALAGRTAATVRDEARLGRQGVGTASDNLLVNGGGQESEPGVQAAGWTYASGSQLQSHVGYARYGDRSLVIANSAPRDSYSYQQVRVEAGELYEAFAWMAVPALSAAGGHAALNLDGPLTALEATAPWTSGTDVGLPLTQNWDWTFVRSLVRAESSGWVTVYLQQGYAAAGHATVHFDGVTFRRVTKYQAEGRRRVDTLYDADGRLQWPTSINDPGLAVRSLHDTARRAQAGLTAWDPAVGGGDLARNVPLPRLQVLAPNISLSTGRITSVDGAATVAGIRASQVPSGLSGAQLCPNPDFLNGLAGYHVYNNSGGSHVQLIHEQVVNTPNPTGWRMRINVSGGTTSPGNGGFTLSLWPTDGPVQPGYYRRGAEIVFTIRAWIPAGLVIDFATNAVGAETASGWLTSQTGTSSWTDYVFRLQVGSSGTFSSTGFFYVYGGVPPFDWYVAMMDAVDVTAQATVFAGSNLRSAGGGRLGDADIVTSQGTSADTTNVGGRGAAVVRDDSRVGRAHVGTASDNLLVNGGGQESDPGAQAAGWTLGNGVALRVSGSHARFGDRSLLLQHDTYASSWSYQTVWVDAGEVYEAFAWIKVPALGAASGQAMINLDGPINVLEVTGPYVSGHDAGVPLTQNWDWTFVRSLVQASASGWVYFYLQQGYSTTSWGHVYFDGVTFRRVPRYPAEGRRRVDTLYDSDTRLTPTVSVHDPGILYRNLNDVSRRAQSGLSAWDPGVGGGTLAQSVPLWTLGAISPNISLTTGRITSVDGGATVDGQHASTLRGNSDYSRLRTGLGGNHLQSKGGMNLRSWDPDYGSASGVCIAWDSFWVRSSGDDVLVPGGSFSGLAGSGGAASTTRYYAVWYDRSTGGYGLELVQYGYTEYPWNAASALGYDRMVIGTVAAAQDFYGSYGGEPDPGTGDEGGGTITPFRREREFAEAV